MKTDELALNAFFQLSTVKSNVECYYCEVVCEDCLVFMIEGGTVTLCLNCLYGEDDWDINEDD